MTGKVFDELTCPDCGGQIGAAAAPGVKPCSCFAPAPESSRKRPLPDEPDPLDMAPNQLGKKLCRLCGKDLAGRSRLKDEKGYICKKCSDAEFEAEAEAEASLVECPECHRKLKPGAFVEYRGTLVCKRCHAGHMDNDKLKVAKVELRLHKKHDKQNVIVLGAIAAALALALLVKTLAFGW